MPHDTTYNTYAKLEADNPWTKAKPAPRQRPDPCTDECPPRCPACGGLQCLCRPRFFPGQLLTDEDLNRLERYVVEKNKLHNRYLHGWGVACGLEVVCDPCASGGVIVRTGYALSPCGDDIIVCNDQAVDVCTLINQCTPQKEPICDSPYDVPPQDCSGKATRWVLAICYDEKPVRGITAQLGMSDATCGTRCGCGGSGGCGTSSSSKTTGGNGTQCNCGGSSAATTSKPRKTYKPECEPTQICEGYRFIAYPAPEPLRIPSLATHDKQGSISSNLLWSLMYANRSRFGPLLERVLCCATRAMELRSAIREGRQLDKASSLVVYTDYASALQEFAADFGIHRCTFVAGIRNQYDDARAWVGKLEYGAALDVATATELKTRVQKLDKAWLDIVSECFCSALLPACPPPEPQNCVPLAVVTVGTNQCRVVDICNWEERKLLVNWRTVMYWLSWVPWAKVQKWIAGLCCGDSRDRSALHLLTLMFGAAFSGIKATAASDKILSVKKASTKKPPADPLETALNSDDLLGHMLKEFDAMRASGSSSDYPEWALLAAKMVDGSALSPLAGQAPTDTSTEVQRLHTRIDDLEKLVKKLNPKIG